MNRATEMLAPHAKRFGGPDEVNDVVAYTLGQCGGCGFVRMLPRRGDGEVLACGFCREAAPDRTNASVMKIETGEEAAPRARKVSRENAREIRLRLAAGEAPLALAGEYGVCAGTIAAVRRGRRWGFTSPVEVRRGLPERHVPGRKLSAQQVRFVRKSCLSLRALARRYDVSDKTILMARRGETYKWVSP